MPIGRTPPVAILHGNRHLVAVRRIDIRPRSLPLRHKAILTIAGGVFGVESMLFILNRNDYNSPVWEKTNIAFCSLGAVFSFTLDVYLQDYCYFNSKQRSRWFLGPAITAFFSTGLWFAKDEWITK